MNAIYEALTRNVGAVNGVLSDQVAKDYVDYAISILQNKRSLFNGQSPEGLMLVLMVYPDLQRVLLDEEQRRQLDAIKSLANQKVSQLSGMGTEERLLLVAARNAIPGKDP